MPMTLFIIRHGATVDSHQQKYKGSIDVALSEEGKRQLKDTATFLKKWLKTAMREHSSGYLRELYPQSEGMTEGLDFIYCSTLSRAVTSAEIIAEGFEGKPQIVPLQELKERNFGLWEGLSFSEIKEHYPDAFLKWSEDPLNYAPPEGESTLQVSKRTKDALELILKRHANDNSNIALVAHGGVNRVLICHILGIPLQNIFIIEQDFACVNVIEYWQGRPVLKLLNARASI